jgi:hypothetical protein
MRSVVAAGSLLALAVVLFGNGTRTLFAAPLAPSMRSVPAAPVYSSPSYALPAAYVPSLEPVPVEPETSGWSNVALLAVVGTVAGVAASSAANGKKQQNKSAMAIAQPDVESATVVAHLAGPIAALSVEGGELATTGDSSASRSLSIAGTNFETTEDLATLSKKLNPTVGFYDPLNLAEGEFWEQSNEATIGFLRHAEIKHGRVAMAGFVGFCIHANGIHFPWKVPGDELCVPGVSPPLLWEGIPTAAKLQIILAIGAFEFYGENAMAKSPEAGGHYMRGGKPGFFPPLKAEKGSGDNGRVTDSEGNPLLPHPVPLNLYDPFGFNKNKTDEWKAQKLQMEINNGRLAMIGLMSLLSEGAVPGSVPALKDLIPASGEINVMSPLDFTKPFFG